MANFLAINYDEASAFAKQFHDEGDDIIQLYSNMRQRVQALRNDWAGDAAEAFYEEMEAELLPALQRVSGALFLCDEVLTKVMKIIHEADEETAVFFKDGINDDFGAGLFDRVRIGFGTIDAPAGNDDFGRGRFEDVLDVIVDNPNENPTTTPPDSNQPSSTPSIPPAPEAEKAEKTEAASETSAAAAGAGGGGGGGGGSQGIAGDLKDLGTGVGPVEQQTGAASGNPQQMPDHIFGSDNAAGGTPSTSPEPDGAGISPSEPASPSGGLGVAAGAAGLAGAAGAGAKVFKDNQDQSGDGT